MQPVVISYTYVGNADGRRRPVLDVADITARQVGGVRDEVEGRRLAWWQVEPELLGEGLDLLLSRGAEAAMNLLNRRNPS